MNKHVLATAALMLLIGAGCADTQLAPEPPTNETTSPQPLPPEPQPEPKPEPAPQPLTEDGTFGPSFKTGVIVVDGLKVGDEVASPIVITGSARGSWFFEGSFPVQLVDANGKMVANAVAQAQGSWMTVNFVPFKVTLTYGQVETPTGTLVFSKENPSGLPQNDDHMSLPVRFVSYKK